MTVTTEETWIVDGTILNQMCWNIKTLSGRAGTLHPKRGFNIQTPYRRGRGFISKPPDQRTLTLVMWVSDFDADGGLASDGTAREAQFNDNIGALRKLFAPYDRQLVMEKYTRLGAGLKHFTAHGECVGTLDPQFSDDLGYADLTIEIMLADPFWYGDAASASVNVGASPTVNNPGDVPADSMTIRFNGPLTNPVLHNETYAPEVWVKVGAAIASGHYIELDTGLFTAKDDTGANMIGAISHSGAHPWMQLAAGNNALTVSADSGSGLTVVTYKPPYD